MANRRPYGFGKALMWEQIGSGIKETGAGLREMDLQKQATARQSMLDARDDQRYKDDQTYRAEQAALAAEDRDFGRAQQGWIKETPGEQQPLPGMGRAIMGAMVPKVEGYRYDASADRQLMNTLSERNVAQREATATREFQKDLENLRAANDQSNTRLAASLRPAAAPAAVTYQRIPAAEGGGVFNPQTGEVMGGGAPVSTKDVAGKDSLETLRALAANPSPSGDLAFQTAFMKLLDPGSVVREGELDMLSQAGSTWDKWGARREQAATGMLTAERRADMLRQAEAIINARGGEASTLPAAGAGWADRDRGASYDPGDIW